MRYINFAEGRKSKKLMLIGIMGIVLVSLIYLVVADTAPTREDLQNELNNLTSQLSNQGHDWLVNYNLTYPSVSVYREGDSNVIARFESIAGGNNFEKYQIFLTNLTENESYLTFDLRSIAPSGENCGVNGKILQDILISKLRLDQIKEELDKDG